MSKELQFKTYCLILYMTSKGLTGRETQELFEKYGVLSYINEFYGVLHSTSDLYIIEDIDIYIEARRQSA